MIDRERWIVYPLLLLALGASLREKFVPPQVIEAPELKASQIVLVDDHQRPRIILKTITEKTGPGRAVPPSQGQIELLVGPGEGHPLAVVGRVSALPEVLAERLVVKNIVFVNERPHPPAPARGQQQKSPAGAHQPRSTGGAAAEKGGGGSADEPPPRQP